MIDRKVDPAYADDSPHLNSPATPTPVVEEDRVFVSFGSQGIACLDRKTGDKIWERRDLRIYQPVRQGDRRRSSTDDNLYVAYDGTDQQFFVALDKETGETRWKKDRNVETDWDATLRSHRRSHLRERSDKPNDNKKSFATATLIDVEWTATADCSRRRGYDRLRSGDWRRNSGVRFIQVVSTSPRGRFHATGWFTSSPAV